MSHIPADLRYSRDHEWVRKEADGSYSVGITDFAQAQLGDVVFVETPKVGQKVKAHGMTGVVESVKAASDIFTPLAGEIVAANAGLADTPDQVNSDPYGSWMFKIRTDDQTAVDALMDAGAYEAYLKDVG